MTDLQKEVKTAVDATKNGEMDDPGLRCHRSCFPFSALVLLEKMHFTESIPPVFSSREPACVTSRKQVELLLRGVFTRKTPKKRFTKTSGQYRTNSCGGALKSHLDVNIFSDGRLRCFGLAHRSETIFVTC